MAIRLGGLSSGLDTQSLVTQLMEMERQPLYALQSRTKYLQSQKNDLSSIKSVLYSLQTSLTDLTYSSAFLGRIANTTDDTVVTATAKNSSSNASYVVQVTSLATASKVTSDNALGLGSGTAATREGGDLGSTDPNAVLTGITAGSFTINGTAIDVTATDTLNTVLNKITASAAGVKAEIVGNKVVLTQKTVGETPTITMGTDNTGFFAAAEIDSTTLTAGTNTGENEPLATSLGVTSGYFSINGAFISVDATTDTLTSVIAKINNSATAGVTAFYDPTTQKIALTSKTLGDEAITLGTNPGTDSSNFLAQAGLTTVVAGADAVASVNGVAVTPTDNTVTVNDVTFSLKSVGTATVTVQNDADAAVEKVKAFIEKYNAAIDAIKAELSEERVKDAETDADKIKGNLRGDYLLTSMESSLRSFMYKSVSSLSSSMNQFSQVGISTGKAGSSVSDAKTGHLVLDEEKLRSALASNSQAVADLFGHGTESVVDESVSTGDGSTTTFTLNNSSVMTVPAPVIKVNGTTYTLVSGTPSTDPADKEYSINYTTGEITFGAAPLAGDTITASYDYGGSVEGLASQMKNMVGELTRVGGSFDSRIGSSGSLTKSMKSTQDSIDAMERRLELREETLYKQFAAMESIMNNMKSQQSWLNSQLSGLASWDTSSSSSE